MSLGSIDLDHKLDRYLTEEPEPKETIFKCEQCGMEIYPSEEYYTIEGENLCGECAAEWLDSMRKIATEDECFED